jgi:hypothetical protein
MDNGSSRLLGLTPKFRTPDIADLGDWNQRPFCALGCEPIHVRFF